jgi:hypothetical protein
MVHARPPACRGCLCHAQRDPRLAPRTRRWMTFCSAQTRRFGQETGRNRVEISFSGGAPSFSGVVSHAVRPVTPPVSNRYHTRAWVRRKAWIYPVVLAILAAHTRTTNDGSGFVFCRGMGETVFSSGKSAQPWLARAKQALWQACHVAADMVVGLFAVFSGLRQAGPSLVAAGRFLRRRSCCGAGLAGPAAAG